MPSRRQIKSQKDSCITGKILGGLGNQLFVIFVTLAYAFEHNTNYKLVNIEKKRKTYTDSFMYKHIELSEKINGTVYKEPHFHYKKIPFSKNLVLDGYFQSYKYFQNFKEEILNKLDFMKYRLDYSRFDGFLHFRLGDYKNIDCHPVCPVDYYINALKKIDSDKPLKFVYYYEKDDKELVDKKINILRDIFKTFTFEGIDTDLPDYEQMLSMTTMKYCIIANSTFSWWGAYLNNCIDKKVFYPHIWFAANLEYYNTSDLYPENWTKIIY